MISDRIEALITHFCKGNKSLFAQQIGVTPSVIGNITGERKGNPSFEVIQKILDAFASVNPDWFILDKGSMLRDSKTSEESKLGGTPIATPSSPTEESLIYNMYKDEKEGKEALIRENGRLEERIHTLEAKLQEYEASPPPVAHKEIREVLGSPETAKDAPIRKHTPGSERFSDRTNLQTEK